MKKFKVILRATHTRISPSTCVDGSDGDFGSRPIIFPYLLTALLGSLLWVGACGGDSPENLQGSSVSTTGALPNTPQTFDAVAKAAPSNDCAHDKVYLASNTSAWKIMSGFGFTPLDAIEIKENCVIHTYVCGTVGYLISGGNAQYGATGIANVMLLGHITPKDGCLPLGETTCAYSFDGVGELRLDCQLVKPLQTPFLP